MHLTRSTPAACNAPFLCNASLAPNAHPDHMALPSLCRTTAASVPRRSRLLRSASRAKPLRVMAFRESSSAAAPAGAFTSKVPGTRANPWAQQELEPKYAALRENIIVDVCVIGAGLSGLTTAYRLAKAGKHVAVLESRVRGAGDTGRSMGNVSTWNSHYYQEVERMAGRDAARRVAESQKAALDFISQTIKEERINCGFEMVPAFLFAHRERGEWPSSQGEARIRKEMEVCQRLGVHARMEKLADDQAPRTSQAGASRQVLAFDHCAVLNPVQYIEGLADAVVRHGGVIYENTRAKGGIATGPSKGRVNTFSGHTVTAREGVVLATHSPINRDQLWVHNRQLPKRSYCIAMEIPSGSMRAGQWFDTADNPHYVRVISRNSLGSGQHKSDMLLVQGEAHHHGIEVSKYYDTWAELEKWTRRTFPEVGRVVYSWSTMEYQPADLIGIYGQDPFDYATPPNYILTGHGRELFTGATTGSEIVASMILGTSHPWGAVYKPSRVIPGALAKYGVELTQYFSTVGLALGKHIIPRNFNDVVGFVSPHSAESKLQPGEGVVAQHGWRKKAMYRDEEGTLHIKSALCTHLGCCVEWNPNDRTFDCPCHGSEFDACGRCIHAPAVADLEDLGTKPAPASRAQRS